MIEWINKLWYTSTMEYYTAINMSELMFPEISLKNQGIKEYIQYDSLHIMFKTRETTLFRDPPLWRMDGMMRY